MVCSDIKETLCAKVAGTRPEKLCYRILSLVATLAFLFALLNVCIGVQEIITEVEIDNLDVMLFPTAYFCMATTLADKMELQEMDSCTSNQAVVAEINLQGNAGSQKTCIEFGDRITSTLARELEDRFKVFDAGTPYNCYTMNEKDKISSVPGKYTQIYFEWDFEVTEAVRQGNDDLTIYAGILDPKGKTFEEQSKNGITMFEIDVVNTHTQVTFTVDELIKQDISSIFTSTKAGANVKKLSAMGQSEAVNEILADDSVVLKYNPSKNSKKMRPVTEIQGVTYEVQNGIKKNRGRIAFLPLSYVTRVVTQRYKTWDEIWSAIGGAWATGVLLVTAFYIQKTVEDPKKKEEKGVPMEQIQCFRLRGASSRRSAIKELFSMASDACEAGKTNLEEGKDARQNVEEAKGES